MASRRCSSTLSRHFRSRLLSWRTATLIPPSPLRSPLPATPRAFQCLNALPWSDTRHFSSRPTNSSDEDIDEEGEEEEDEEEEEEDEEEEEEGEESWDPEDGDTSGSRRIFQTRKSDEEKAMEATKIGYRVVGPLDPSENPFKPYEPVFAVVQIGSHQFKVSNGDSIFTERLKFCEVNDKLILNRVLMVGSKSQTIIGRPILPVAAVHAVVEEHALDAKVIIFKKKRRKNYRRTKGHRQELTKLRITDIQGIDRLESVPIAA